MRDRSSACATLRSKSDKLDGIIPAKLEEQCTTCEFCGATRFCHHQICLIGKQGGKRGNFMCRRLGKRAGEHKKCHKNRVLSKPDSGAHRFQRWSETGIPQILGVTAKPRPHCAIRSTRVTYRRMQMQKSGTPLRAGSMEADQETRY